MSHEVISYRDIAGLHNCVLCNNSYSTMGPKLHALDQWVHARKTNSSALAMELRLSCTIDLARNGNSGCANEIVGCAKCHF